MLNIMNAKYQTDDRPIEEGCGCPTCQRFSRAYLRHLLKSGEMLSQRLLVMHNLWFYNHLMQEIRDALEQGTFAGVPRGIQRKNEQKDIRVYQAFSYVEKAFFFHIRPH